MSIEKRTHEYRDKTSKEHANLLIVVVRVFLGYIKQLTFFSYDFIIVPKNYVHISNDI